MFTLSFSSPRLAVAGLILLGLAGCSSGYKTGHEKNVNAANERWLNLRSGLMLNMASQQFETGDLEQAEKTLLGALELDPANPRLYVLAGRVALEKGQLERAHQRLSKGIELDAELPEGYYYRGVVMQRWQRYDAALTDYQKAYELRADDPAYLLAVGEMLVASDQADAALALLGGKETYFDQSAAVRVALGQIHQARGDYAKAADYFRQATILVPEDTQVLEMQATAEMAAGQYDKAIRSLETLTNDPRMTSRRDLARTLGGAYAGAGRAADAKDQYLKLTRSDPRDAESWIALMEIAWSQKDSNGALLAANRVMALAPNRADGYLMAGMVWQARGNVDEALRHFDRAAEAAPASATAVILRGITLERAGRAKAAAEAYQEALRREPNDPRAQKLLAQLSAAE